MILKDLFIKKAIKIYQASELSILKGADFLDKTKSFYAFLAEKYEGGKKLVPNTNPDTKEQHPQVTVNTLLENDGNYYVKLRKEYEGWLADKNKPEGSGGNDPGTLHENFKKLKNNIKEDKDLQEYISSRIQDALSEKDNSESSLSIKKFFSEWEAKYKGDKSTEEEKGLFLKEEAGSIATLCSYYIIDKIGAGKARDFDYFGLKRGWMQSSNNKAAWQFHNFARGLGYEGSHYLESKQKDAEKDKWLSSFDGDLVEALSISYKAQQAIFKKLGLDHVIVYRGVEVSDPLVVGSKTKMESRPCASTSNSKSIAEGFGNTTLKFKVPVERVLLSPSVFRGFSGSSKDFGGNGEDEYMVMGLSDLVGEVVER